MKILIIEDETELAQAMSEYLTAENYLCELAFDYHEAFEKIALYDYDCILLDITLPGGSGMEILTELKAQKKKDGVIIISAKNSLDDRINGLQIGADDYIAKPFHLAELAARVYAVIRRRNFGSTNIIQQGELQIDLLAKTVSVNETLVELTKKELGLLLYLIANQNQLVSKGALAEHLSGDLADMLDNHDFVYAHIKNLKRKLAEAGGGHHIRTVYGTGYKWQS